MVYSLDWGVATSNGTYSTVDGADTIDATIVTTTNAAGETANSASSGTPAANALWVSGLTEEVSTTITFDAPVENLNFEIFDIDSSVGGWDDKLTIIALNAAGEQVVINFSDLDGVHSVADSNVLNADGSASSGVETSGADDSVTVAIAGPIVSIQFLFDNGESMANSGMFGVSNMTYDAVPEPDYIVEGTSGDDLIDFDYIGDPEGDLVDHNDNETGTNGDSIVAGDGNDTILAGAGDDSISGGDGEDVIEGGLGDDTIIGGNGTDTIDGGAGNDSIDGGDRADSIQGGDGNDTINVGGGNDSALGGAGDDLMSGGLGSDTLSGGDDADTFQTISVGDVIDGNEGGTDFDTLDLSGSAPSGGSLSVTFSGAESGTVDFLDAGGVSLGTASFSNIENIVGIPTTSNTVYDMIEISDAVPGNGDVLTTASGGLVEVDEPVVFETIASGSIAAGDTATIDGVTYTVVSASYQDGDYEHANGVTSATTGIVVLDDGAGGQITYLVPSDPSGDMPDITSYTATSGVSGSTIDVPDVDGDDAVSLAVSPLNYIVEGTAAGDLIDSGYTDDPEGDMVDNGDALDGSDDDYITAGDGDDTVLAGDGDDSVLGDLGDDSILGGAGADTVRGGLGDDTIVGGLGDDSIVGNEDNDSMSGGDGDDTVLGETGDDTVIGGAGDDHLEGNEGEDLIIGGAGNDFLRGSYDNDTLYGGTGDDFIWGGYGDDLIVVEDNFGNDIIEAEEAFETDGDTLDLSAVTSDLSIDLTSADPEQGSFTDGVSTATFIEVENIILGGGNDTLVLGSGSGADSVIGFSLPTDNGDGTFSGVDVLDVTALTDLNGAIVNTDDVVVSDTNGDGTGDAILTFPSGESLTLVGVLASDVSDPDVLEAMGIAQPNYIVDGTAGADLIDGSYLTDPDGDVIDGLDDAAGTNNDSVLAGDGDDTVLSYAGDDTIDGGAGADNIDAGSGDDVLLGGAGNDTLNGWFGDDSLEGGSGDDSLVGWTGDDTFLGGAGADIIEAGDGEDVIIVEDNFGNDTIDGGDGGAVDNDTLDLSATTAGITIDLTNANPENGSFTDGTSTATFTDIETIILGGGDDTVVLADGSGSDTVSEFEGPLDNGDGTFTGQDQINVSGMTDLNGDPVDVGDVVVSDDGTGNAVLTFPNGESVTLLGITPAELDSEGELEAIGIPPISLDYIVDGTAAGEVIDAAYTGDPDGDMIDNNDALDGSNDDSVVAGAGNDTIYAGDGNDSVLAGDGDDSVFGGAGDDFLTGGNDNDVVYGGIGVDSVYGSDGDDTVFGGLGDDLVSGDAGDDSLNGNDGDDMVLGGAGSDTLVGEAGDDTLWGQDGDDLIVLSGPDLDNDVVVGGETGETIGDTLNASAVTGDVNLVFTANEETGTLSDGTDTVNFSEIENIVLGSGDDTIGGFDGDTNIAGGAGDDNFAVSSGADTLSGGDDADTFAGITVGDVIDGGEGGNDSDTLDLTNAAPVGGHITVNYTDAENGTVEFFDAGGVSQGTASFANIENFVGAPDINLTIHDAIELSGGSPSGGTTLYTSSGDMVEVDEPLVFTVDSSGELAIGDTVDIDGVSYTISALDEVAGEVTHSDGAGGSETTSVVAVDITLDDGAGGTLNYLVPVDSYGDVEEITEFSVDSTQTWPFTGGSVAEAVIDTDDVVSLADTYTVTMYDMIETGGAVTVGTPLVTADGDLVEVDEPITFTVLTEDEIGVGDSVNVDGVDYIITDMASYTGDVTNFDETVSATLQGITMVNGAGDTLNYLIPTDGAGDIEGITQLTIQSQDNVDPFAAVNGTANDLVTLAVCFVAGTRIKTVSGEIAIEDLRVGQLVQTMDSGLQPIRWIGATKRAAVGELAPVRIRKGALGNDRDLWVSPQHRMMLAGWQAEVLFGEREVLATAKSLINDETIVQVSGGDVEYYHILFDAHEIVFAEGAASESFHPGVQSLAAIDAQTRDEVLALFPELALGDFASYGPAARKSLKSFETQLLSGYGFFTN